MLIIVCTFFHLIIYLGERNIEIRLFPKNKDYLRNILIHPYSLFHKSVSMQGQFMIQFPMCRIGPLVCLGTNYLQSGPTAIIFLCTETSHENIPPSLPHHSGVVVVIPLCFALSPFVKSNCSLNIIGTLKKYLFIWGRETEHEQGDEGEVGSPAEQGAQWGTLSQEPRIMT